MTAAPPLGVVLVNYKRAVDTIECLESLLRSPVALRVVVVENASGDGSLEELAAWAAGRHAATVADPAMARFSTPALPKPVDHVVLTEAEALAGPPRDVVLTLIAARANLGFAGGNNVGLRYLLGDPRIGQFWLLNNDTVVEPDAAGIVQRTLAASDRIGMCGTVVRFYHRPEMLQALNGHRFSAWKGTSLGIGAGQPATTAFDAAQVARETDFVLGASLAVSRAFLDTVGLMEERYFLYYEEVDWAYRGAGKFDIGFAGGATVFHKEGGSIGSSSTRGGRSDLSDYYLLASKLRFIRAFRPALLPVHWAIAAGQIGLRLVRRQPRKAKVMTRALFGLKG